jgi:extracellular factor (EF) 3-hydroxypalmitic acid methyl ester biosynthesis protein
MPNPSNIQSLVTFKNTQGISARGTILRLSRSTVVFEVYNPYSIVQLSEVLQHFTIRRGERAIYAGRAVVTNLVNTGLMLIVSVSLRDAWSDLAGLLETGRGISDEVRRFIRDFDAISDVRAKYKLVVAAVRNFLSELVRWLEQVDLDAGVTFEKTRAISEEIFSDIAAPLFPRLSQLFQDFEEEARAVPEEALSYHKLYAQRDLHPLLLTVPFVHRTLTKPLGYAGDFEMVNMMVRNQREGSNTYAQLLHKFYVSAKVCQAHRNRIGIMTRLLSELAQRTARGMPARVLNIGCGPAQEVLNLIQAGGLSQNFHINLIDFSQNALDATRRSLTEAAGSSCAMPRIEYVHESIHDLLRNAVRPESSEKAASYDFVYCAGLFDYFSDRVCARLISLFRQWTKPEGRVLVTNVHPCNEYRAVMEHILEWYLTYRDEEQMKKLVPPSAEKKVYTDDTGVNVFLEVRAAASQS